MQECGHTCTLNSTVLTVLEVTIKIHFFEVP